MKKQLMNNKKDFKNFIIFKILPLIITMASLVAAFFMFTLRNKSSITTRNKEYLKESTTSLQQRLNVKFESSLHNISSIAYLFGESISSVQSQSNTALTIEEFEKRQHTFNIADFDNISKNTTGRPINCEDEFPVDEQIKKLQKHGPKVKIDKITYDFTEDNHLRSPLGKTLAKNLNMIYDICTEHNLYEYITEQSL